MSPRPLPVGLGEVSAAAASSESGRWASAVPAALPSAVPHRLSVFADIVLRITYGQYSLQTGCSSTNMQDMSISMQLLSGSGQRRNQHMSHMTVKGRKRTKEWRDARVVIYCCSLSLLRSGHCVLDGTSAQQWIRHQSPAQIAYQNA